MPFKRFLYFLAVLLAVGQSSPANIFLESKTPVFDFGEIREGRNAPVSFTITNTGSRDARLSEIRTFAACVQTRPLKQLVLPPGKSIELDFVFESLGYGGASIQKNIEIHYNNRKKSPLLLKVRGSVLPLEKHQAPLGEMMYSFCVLIDIRTPEEYRKEHILGAVNIPGRELEEWAARMKKTLPSDIILYLYSGDGSHSDSMASKLRARGLTNFLSLVGGLKEWKFQYGRKLLVSRKF
jgi:rhodanese-related sulfurtransferase